MNFGAFKLDLSKAYDRVDWCFLEKALVKLGFNGTWVRWIMACVSSVHYPVRFNGALLDSFQPSRGLRQGDPLSPYLFLFVADALSTVLQKEITRGEVEELRVSRNAPGISHLLFADDAMLFFKAKREQAEKIMRILQVFQQGTGQLLSPAKCSILVRESLDPATQAQIRQTLQVERVEFDSKYGLPTPDGRQKKDRFQSVKEKISKRMSTWSEKFLSSGAKDVLIKSIAQAIPTYMMSVFQLSDSVCEDIECSFRKFWWGEEKDQRRNHWVAWEKFSRCKARGGLGFRDMKNL